MNHGLLYEPGFFRWPRAPRLLAGVASEETAGVTQVLPRTRGLSHNALMEIIELCEW